MQAPTSRRNRSCKNFWMWRKILRSCVDRPSFLMDLRALHPSKIQVLEMLLRIADKIMVTITCDTKEKFFGRIHDEELFAMSKKTMAKTL